MTLTPTPASGWVFAGWSGACTGTEDLIQGVADAPPETGAKWAGADLQAGLELVKLLFGRPYAEEVR